MFRANCKFAQIRNCVAQFENFEIAYRFRNCPPILKLPLNFEIAAEITSFLAMSPFITVGSRLPVNGIINRLSKHFTRWIRIAL